MDEVQTWMDSKKKTYWKVWPTKENKYAWVLFFSEDTGNYHTGTEDTIDQCHIEIQWAIASHIKRQTL